MNLLYGGLNKVPPASNNLGETGTINRCRFWYAHVTDVTILFYHILVILQINLIGF